MADDALRIHNYERVAYGALFFIWNRWNSLFLRRCNKMHAAGTENDPEECNFHDSENF